MVLKDKTIAVTGASGMIGAYICRALLKRGANVIGVVRNPDKAAFLTREGVTFRRADLADARSLTDAFVGVDAVVSNAALYRLTNLDWESNYLPNKTGTENFLTGSSSSELIFTPRELYRDCACTSLVVTIEHARITPSTVHV